jgi:putative flavoprotein involved in K+ transport
MWCSPPASYGHRTTNQEGLMTTTHTAQDPALDRTGPERVGTVIVGAGQTGLATAYYLGLAGVACVVLDENDRVGDQWRRRYDSLRLNSPAQYDGLPGMAFPAPRNTFPTGGQMADYLEAYAEGLDLKVRPGQAMRSVELQSDGRWRVSTSAGDLEANNVVIACGAENLPRVPPLAGRLDPGIRQLHSSAYRNPGQLLPGPVLVVGCGQSGADVALECARAGHETVVSGQVKAEIPFPIESARARAALPLLWWAANHLLTVRTPIGRRARPAVRAGGAPLLRVKRADLIKAGVRVTAARTVDVVDGRPALDDGSVLDVANIVWCTGFRHEYDFIKPDVTGDDGFPAGDGVTVPGAPGLYFVGLIFQTAFASMLIGGAGRDSSRVAEHIAARTSAGQRLASQGAQQPATHPS